MPPVMMMLSDRGGRQITPVLASIPMPWRIGF